MLVEPLLQFAPDVLALIRRRMLRDQRQRVSSAIVTGISVHGEYMEKSQMELDIYETDLDIFAKIYVNGPPQPAPWYPQTALENLAAGFPIWVQYFPDWGLR